MKEIGVDLVYNEHEQTCEQISQYIIPVDCQPTAYYGMTRLYFTGCGMTYSWLEKYFEKYFGKYTLVETVSPSVLRVNLTNSVLLSASVRLYSEAFHYEEETNVFCP